MVKMNTKFKQGNKGQEGFNPFHFIDFSKASPEAIEAILNALNAEVDAAIASNHYPTVDGAFSRLAPTSPMVM